MIDFNLEMYMQTEDQISQEAMLSVIFGFAAGEILCTSQTAKKRSPTELLACWCSSSNKIEMMIEAVSEHC